LEALFEDRDELTTNAGARAVGVAISGVFAPRLAEAFKVSAKL